MPPPDFAAIAPIVNACAEEGDRVSLEVLAAAGQELAEAGALAFAKLRLIAPHALEGGPSPAPVWRLPGACCARRASCAST